MGPVRFHSIPRQVRGFAACVGIVVCVLFSGLVPSWAATSFEVRIPATDSSLDPASRGLLASQWTPSAPERRVVPVLLPPGTEIGALQASAEVVDLGTGFFHGYAIAHLAFPGADAGSVETLVSITPVPSTARTARPQRPSALQSLQVRRRIGALVVNPEALALYAEPQLAATKSVTSFDPTETPSLDGSSVDMLILTTENLAPAFQQYADAKTALGLPTIVRTVEWVRQHYPAGADLQETLRDFIRRAYELWGIHSLLIGGDTEIVPVRYASSVYSLEGNVVPTDLYYACLDGDWNADRDASWGEGFVYSENRSDMADLYPELYVGRLPVMTPADVATYRAKLESYVEPTVLGYQNKMAFLAEVIWPSNYKAGDPILKNGADNAERLIQLGGLSRPDLVLRRLYETPASFPGSEALTLAAGLAVMNEGFGLVTDIGHGFRYTMSLGNASMTNVQALLLQNTNRPFFLNMLNCSATAFDFPCLAEKFLLSPNGGAVGVIGASREAYPDNIQLYQEAWFQKVFSEGYTVAGEALHEARLRYLHQTYDDGAYRWSNFITAYLGDPQVPIWTSSPRTATVTHAATLQISARSLAVTVKDGGAPVQGATVCLWMPGSFYTVARTNRSGVAMLEPTVEMAGTASLAVCGSGIIPHRGSVQVLPAIGPSLRATGVVVIQDSGPGTTGNGNGKLEAGETALLSFEIQNVGSSTADAVTVQAQTSDPSLVLQSAALTVGNLAPGQAAMSSTTAVTVSGGVLDQHPVRLDLVLRTFQTWSWNDRVRLDLLQVSPKLQRVWVDDTVFGNGNLVPETNETYTLQVEIKNYGFAQMESVTGQLLSTDPDVTILVGNTNFAAAPHLGTASGSFRLRESNVTQRNLMLLVLLDSTGRSWSFRIETRRPSPPTGLAGDPSGGAGVLKLTWNPSPSGDVLGYHVYRATRASGPWTRASQDVVRHSTSFRDDGLQSGMRYFYAIASVDSSALESVRTPALQLSTNPGLVAGWPRQLGMWCNSSPVAADLDGNGELELIVGTASGLYAWKPNGEEHTDGDANPLTQGVFTSIAGNFMPGLAAADLDHDGRDEVVACTFDTKLVYVFGANGVVRAGWPRSIVSTPTPGVWATPAIADLDLDGRLEILVLGLDGRLYAWRDDGSEWRDGDANPSTQGVFFVLPSGSNWSRGAPTVANLLPDDATPEIVFGTEGSRVYVLRADGSVAPGWPRQLPDRVNAAPSLGDIDGDGGLDIAVPCRNGQIYVLRANGSDLPGWPRPLPNQWNALTPSVALHDFDGDGKLELVAASTGPTTSQGSLYVFDFQGNTLPGWPVDVHTASEASPLLADLDNDAVPEIVYGGESGLLHAFRLDGSGAAGFPIKVGAEIRGTPTLLDADGDGYTDLFFGGWDQQAYLWKFPSLYVLRNAPWSAFKGNMLRNGAYGFRQPTDSDPIRIAPPLRTALEANVPNPFNPTTTLRFEIGGVGPQRVRLVIFDAHGRRVRSIVDRDLEPGRYAERWDGRDEAGQPVSSGVYFYRLDAAGERFGRKMVLVR